MKKQLKAFAITIILFLMANGVIQLSWHYPEEFILGAIIILAIVVFSIIYSVIYDNLKD